VTLVALVAVVFTVLNLPQDQHQPPRALPLPPAPSNQAPPQEIKNHFQGATAYWWLTPQHELRRSQTDLPDDAGPVWIWVMSAPGQ
jgi:hypothetical protein